MFNEFFNELKVIKYASVLFVYG